MNRKLLAAIAIVVALVSLSWLYLSHRPIVRPLKGAQFDRLGQFAGDEISKLLGNHGTVVVVQWDATFAGIPRYDVQITQFKKQMASHGIDVRAVETIKVKFKDTTLPARFAKLVSQHAKVDAIVLVGTAYGLTVADLTALSNPHPQLISVMAFQTELKTMFEKQLISLAITDALLTENLKSTDRDFLVLTAENATALPNSPELINAP